MTDSSINHNWLKLAKAQAESNRKFHEIVYPRLPENIKKEVDKCQTFSISIEGNEPRCVINLNGQDFDITEWYEKGISIFDVYE